MLCDDVEIADRPRRRMRGLLGRTSLDPGEGMLLQPAPSIHTAFMRFAIDVVFVDGTLRVTKIVPELRPWRMAGAHRSWAVIELAAGEVKRREVMVGDQLGVVQITDRLGAFIVNSARNENRWDEATETSLDAALRDAGHDRNGDSQVENVGNGPAEAQTNVLVVGADRRFRSVAAALLTRRGCAVTLADHPSSIADLVGLEGADVVVLDAGVSLTDAARTVAQIETLDQPLGVVVVADQADPGLSAMPVLPKWGSFETLYRAVRLTADRQTRSSNGRGR